MLRRARGARKRETETEVDVWRESESEFWSIKINQQFGMNIK